MEIILSESVSKLGSFGDIVNVKSGYARNYLLPKKKALRATKENLKWFEERRKELEKEQKLKLEQAKKNFEIVDNITIKFIRNASEDGKLYGSISLKDIAHAIFEATKVKVDALQIILSEKSREVGAFEFKVALHPNIVANGLLVVARTTEEIEQILATREEEAKKAKAKSEKEEEKKEAKPSTDEEKKEAKAKSEKEEKKEAKPSTDEENK